MQFQLLTVSALATIASALFTADTSKPPSGNAITAPVNQVVPGGKPFTITWTPSTKGKVSIVLLKGPGNNVQYLSTIADSIDNSGSFVWNVDPSLPPMDTHYAVEIISEDHTYQYSTQIGIGPSDGKDGKASVTSYGSVETAPPTSTAEGTAVCGALDECDSSTSFGSVETAPPSSAAEGTAVCGALDECPSSTAAMTGMVTGTSNVSSPIVSPTAPITKPSSLATVAVAPGASTLTSAVTVATAGANAGSTSGPSAAPSSALAVHGASLSGAAALVAGLIGLLAL